MERELAEHLGAILSGLMVPYSINRTALGTAGPHVNALWDRYGGTFGYPTAEDFTRRILEREAGGGERA